jgi:coenzyme F420-reducing hydrogenase beta subunit
MRTEKEGFLIFDVSEAGCIDCGLCTKICPQNKIANATKPHRVVALRYKDDKVLLNSASGGAFVGMAATVLEQDGVVYGAAYQRDLTVVHIAVESICDLKKLQSSKYVQSDTLNTYSDVKTMLRGGREILYSGTPCQIGGLYAYLGRDYPNLLTAEIICHGVPSPKLFAKYLEWLKIKYNEDILHYDFRDKTVN